MATIVFHAQFTAGKVGKVGLAPTIDVDRIARADGTRVALVTGGATTEGIRGLYRYVLTGADLQTYDYLGVFITSDTTVDAQELPALWTRWSEAVATDATGKVSPADGSIASASFAAGATVPRVTLADALTAPVILGGWTDEPAGYAGRPLDALVFATAVENPDDYAADYPDAWIVRSTIGLPAGGGGTAADWTDDERKQIRHRLGLDGATAVPAAVPSLATPGAAMALTAGERTATAGAVWANAGRTLTSSAPPTGTEVAAAVLAAVPAFRNVSGVAAPTVADCLAAAFVECAGAESIVGLAYTKKTPAGATFRSFILDAAAAPTARS